MSLYVRYAPAVLSSGGGGGTVTSVGLADGSTNPIYTITGSPITTNGTLTFTLLNESANMVFAGPTTGSAAQPTFRALVAADLPTGNLTDVGTDGIVVTNGTGAVIGTGTSLAQHVADTTHNGYLSSTDWNTFNGKQPAGNYITALTGDGTATGPGSAVFTLATVNSSIGTFAAITINAKGLATAGANLSGDITTSGSVSTLATVNANVGSFTLSNITVNAKGLVTAASTTATGNLTDAGTDGIVITNGTNAVIGTGTSIAQHVADTTHNGYLSSTDWNTFNNKQPAGSYVTAVSVATANGLAGSSSGGTTPALTLSTTITGILQGNGTAISAATTGNLTDVGTDGITVTGGTGAVLGSGTSLSQHVSDSTHNGYLSSTDWSTFNGKQAAGNYITALTGDVTATGPGSVAATLATVNANVGTFASATFNAKGLATAAANLSGDATTSGAALTLATVNANIGTFASVTVNAKGLVTAAANLSGDATTSSSTLTLATVNSNIGTFAAITINAKGLATAGTALTGDITSSGAATTLATVNSNVGSFTSANITVNAKGLITAASNGTASVGALGTYTSFTSSGTFTTAASSSTSTIYRYIVQGGGAGGGGGASSTNAGGGGGAGAYAEGTFTGIAASTGITVTINTGGTGGTSTNAGSAGGSASLALATAITCAGGSGGGATSGGGGYTQGGAGGAVTSGSPNIRSWTGQTGGNGFGVAGTFAIGGLGGGGGGAGTSSGGTGNAGTVYGSGGAGGTPSNSGGNGVNGIIIIEQLTP